MTSDLLLRSVYLPPEVDAELSRFAAEKKTDKNSVIGAAVAAKLAEWTEDGASSLDADLQLGRRPVPLSSPAKAVRADSKGGSFAPRARGGKLADAKFPTREGFFPVTRVPVFYSPIIFSPERLVVGVVCSAASGKLLVRANSPEKLEGLYGEHASAALLGIEFALTSLSAALEEERFSLDAYRVPVANLSFGPAENGEARSLEEAGTTWLSATSSLHRVAV